MRFLQSLRRMIFQLFGTIGDIGGGQGHLVEAILKSSQNSRGILFDQPHVIGRVKADEAIGRSIDSARRRFLSRTYALLRRISVNGGPA